MDLRSPPRSRQLWLGAVVVAVAVVGLFVYSFVGTVVLGLFVYYGARPAHRRVAERVDSRAAAATLTMLALVVPMVALVGYAGVVAFREFAAVAGPQAVETALNALPGDPRSVSAFLREPDALVERLGRIEPLRSRLTAVATTAGALATGLLHLTLALSLAFFLLRDGGRLDGWVRERAAAPDTAAYSLLRGVDADLERVYFGNVATVGVVTAAAVLVYNGYNALAPAAVTLPVPTLLALLTGLATFVPIVVGKLVYVPATAYLLREAAVADAGYLAPAALLAASFLLLDLLPQTVLRPLLSSRTLHGGLVLFAYVFGAALFGWYGLFLGPLLAVVVVQVVAHAFPHVVTGVPIDTVADGVDIGSDPVSADAAADDGDPTDDEATGGTAGEAGDRASGDAADGD
ncbi:AI-2E family transporter [Halobaculum lipolyticum]|uniref:AI-2E family transporter n=1 Tax=Halobaculum lipolyticum TaxID=3032001 RepID=A0ABD5WLJ0_9EURY|nr:AI-2E family transporter [Halobaculum sp. DT31]